MFVTVRLTNPDPGFPGDLWETRRQDLVELAYASGHVELRIFMAGDAEALTMVNDAIANGDAVEIARDLG